MQNINTDDVMTLVFSVMGFLWFVFLVFLAYGLVNLLAHASDKKKRK